MNKILNKYWVSCDKFTVIVYCNGDNKIYFTAPILSKFLGQPFSNLEFWLKKFNGVEIVRMF